MFGNRSDNISPIKKKPLLTKNINFTSFTIPAAAIPANHPNA